MVRRILVLLLIAGCLAIPCTATEHSSPTSTDLSGTVTWIYDGDTLQIEPVGTVRLIGIDSPEKADNPDRDRKFIQLGAQPGQLRQISRDALRFNIAIAKGKRVTLTLEEPRHDRHGRTLAYVYLDDGRLLNRILLEEGLAVVYRRFDFALKDDFLAAEEVAQKTGRGLWQRSSRPQY